MNEEEARAHIDLFLRNRLAITWTAGKAGDDAKRVTRKAWNETQPLAGELGALAGQFAERIKRANPAVVTRASGLVSVDCDDEAGLAQFEALSLPQTMAVQSSAPYRRHFHFRAPPGNEFSYFEFGAGNVTGKTNQYLVFPPAVHPSGAVYRFLNGTNIAELSREDYALLVQLAGGSRERERQEIQEDPDFKVREPGRRPHLFRYACALRRWMSDPDELTAAVLAYNERHCDPPVERRHVVTQVQGALKLTGGQELDGRATARGPRAPIRAVRVRDFAAVDEPGARVIVGEDNDALIPEGGDVVVYGDGGAGKTTLAVDLACHVAAGAGWLGIPVPNPRRVLLLENEGPRPLFRRKLKAKLADWGGPPVELFLRVIEEPWGELSFSDPEDRAELAARIAELECDVLIAGPAVRLGMEEAGTLQQVRDFMLLVAEVRKLSKRPLTVILVHHENKRGQVSGAWEGAPETLLQVQGQGNGRTRLFIQKARWSSTYHGKAFNLLWTDGQGFEVEEKHEVTDEERVEQIHGVLADFPGCAWNKVLDASTGGSDHLARVRDAMLARGEIVNVVKKDGVDVAINHLEPSKPARLYNAGDPTIQHFLQTIKVVPLFQDPRNG
jgi:hypothetical protein